jgi:hypothetical protein
LEKEPMESFIDNPDASYEQKQCLGKRTEVLNLAVTIRVGFIGGPVAHADRKKGDHRGCHVERGMSRFRKNPQASRQDSDNELAGCKEDGCKYGRCGDKPLFSSLLIHAFKPASGKFLSRANTLEFVIRHS